MIRASFLWQKCHALQYIFMVEVTIFYNDVYVTYYDISCVGNSVSISSSVREDKKRGLLYEDFFRWEHSKVKFLTPHSFYTQIQSDCREHVQFRLVFRTHQHQEVLFEAETVDRQPEGQRYVTVLCHWVRYIVHLVNRDGHGTPSIIMGLIWGVYNAANAELTVHLVYRDGHTYHM